jgi:hypothetical protein
MRAPGGNYAKRALHDRIVPKAMYQDMYSALKAKYAAKWIALWGEGEDKKGGNMGTDPEKHVHEDISIVSFLVCLWQIKHGEDARKQVRFCDLGAGNGFLVHLLAEEGFLGYGVDIARRDIWKLFGDHTHVEVGTVDAPNAKFDVRTGRPVVPKDPNGTQDLPNEFLDVWLLGNHSDELTPWLPIITARSNLHARRELGAQRNHCHFWVLPCCFHDLSGAKNTFGRTIPMTHDKDTTGGSLAGKYGCYLRWIDWIAQQVCGFKVERQWMRIPSTKNVCMVGTQGDAHADDVGWEEVEEAISDLTAGVVFQPRLSDREKGRLRDEQKRRRAEAREALANDPVEQEARQQLLEEFGGMFFGAMDSEDEVAPIN